MQFSVAAVDAAFRAGASVGLLAGIVLTMAAYLALRIWQERRP